MSDVDENPVDIAEEEVAVEEVEAPKGKMSVEEALKVNYGFFFSPKTESSHKAIARIICFCWFD